MAADPQIVDAVGKVAGFTLTSFLKVMAVAVPIVVIALLIRRNISEAVNRLIWRINKTDKKCPLDGGMLIKRRGKYGPFLGCSNYPKCTYTEGGNREVA